MGQIFESLGHIARLVLGDALHIDIPRPEEVHHFRSIVMLSALRDAKDIRISYVILRTRYGFLNITLTRWHDHHPSQPTICPAPRGYQLGKEQPGLWSERRGNLVGGSAVRACFLEVFSAGEEEETSGHLPLSVATDPGGIGAKGLTTPDLDFIKPRTDFLRLDIWEAIGFFW